MVWTFIALSAGALIFAGKMLMDHLREADMLNGQIAKLERERLETDEKIADVQRATGEARAKIETLKTELSTRQDSATSLQAEINQRKGEKARRGQYRV